MPTRKFEEKRAIFGQDILVLNGTDGSSTDAGEAIIFDSSANDFTLLLNGIDSNSTNIDVDIALNGTDSSSTDAGDSILLEDATTVNDEDVAITSFPFDQPEHGGFVVLEQTETNQGDITVNSIKESSVGDGVMIENAAISGTDNKIINGNFAVNQRAAAFTAAYTAATPIPNNDDTYHFDRWYTLSDGNDIVDIHSWGRTTGSRSFATGGNDGRGRWLPLDAGFAMSTAVETANKKFGIAQIIESANCNDLRGQKCTLSFKARLSGTLTATIKAAVVGWFGTPDTVTSDIISAWNGNGVTPTLIASAEYQNDPSAITTLNNKFQTHKIVTSISESITNIIVFIWSDSTSTTVDDQFYITNVQLERGEFENPKFQNEDYGTTLRKCQRYYWQTGRSAAQYTVAGSGVAVGTTVGYIQLLHGPMRVAGTVAENGDTYMYDGGNSAVTALTTTTATVESTWMYLTASGGGLAAANAIQWYTGNTTADWISVDSEL